MKAVDTEKLWKEYEKKPTQELREQLILAYAQLVKIVAWYDNEMGYSTQMVRTAKYLMTK